MTHERFALVVAEATADQLAVFESRPAIVIAADSGVHAVLARGWTPDRVVGDLDSADPDAVEQVVTAGATVERHAETKNETDLELAIAAAVNAGATEVHVVVRADGRLDHQVANLVVLANPAWRHVAISAGVGEHSVWVVHARREVVLEIGSHLALLPIGGPATVTSRGVAYPLAGEELSPFAGRGIANEVAATPVEIDVADGVVVVVSSPTRTSDPADAPG